MKCRRAPNGHVHEDYEPMKELGQMRKEQTNKPPAQSVPGNGDQKMMIRKVKWEMREHNTASKSAAAAATSAYGERTAVIIINKPNTISWKI